MARAFRNKLQSMISAAVIAALGRALRDVYKNVADIDSKMAELQRTTSMTSQTYQSFLKESIKNAKELGIAVTDLLESTTTFARLGYSLDESGIFAKLTTMYGRVTGVSTENATSAMTAIIKAYDVTADNAQNVLDKLIKVGDSFAISPAELGEGMNNAASSLAAYGNTLEEAMGMLAAANATVQNISKSSTAVRTIVARISASTAELEELGEGTENLLTTADLDAKMRAFGVAITNTNGELRSTYDILSDVANKWDEFTSLERAAITDMFAGTRQGSIFSSMMQNWQDAEKAVAVAANSAGTLNEYYSNYLDTIEGKMNQLQASWQEFSTNILSSDIVKFFIDILKVIAEVLNGITSFGNGIVVKMAIATAAIVLLNLAINKVKMSIDGAFGGGAIKTFGDFVAAIQLGAGTAGAALKKLFTNSLSYFTIFLTLITTIQNKGLKFAIAIATIVGIIVVAIVAGIKTVDGAMKLFMATNPIGWILLGIAAIITAIKTLSELIQGASFNDLKEAAKDAKDEWKNTADEVNNVSDALEKVRDRIKEINSLDKLTLVDQNELKALQQQEKILEEELKNKQEAALIKEREASQKTMTAMDKYQNQHTRQNYAWWQWLVSPWWAIGEIIADNVSETQEDKTDRIFKNWNEASQEEKDYITNYIQELNGLLDGFTYYTGEDLQDWQIQMNDYFDQYYSLLDRKSVATGDIGGLWDSLFARIKYSGATDALKELANNLGVTEDNLKELYSSNSDVKTFIDYLQDIGLFSWDDADAVEGLVYQVRALADAAQVVSSKGYLTILDEMTKKYDIISDAIEDMNKSGIIAEKTIKELMEEFPTLTNELINAGVLTKTADGYKMSENALITYLDSVRESYNNAANAAQAYYDKVVAAYGDDSDEAKSARQSLENALKNKEELEVVINTLQRTDLISEFTDKLKEQSDKLEDQLDKYKDIIEIRKELLKTYEEEINYQKTLAQKQKAVNDLQTKLQLAMLDNSAAGRAHARSLQEELNKAQEDLESYTLEHAIDDLTNQLNSEYEEYESFINEQVKSIEDAINNAAQMTSDSIREVLRNGYVVSTHHTGGFVGNTNLKDNEEFAKLLKGELVVTPSQMSKFMSRTLPNIVSQGNGTVNYNSPLISINCDTVTKDSLPELNNIVNMAVDKVKQEIDSKFSRSSKTGIDKFKI